MIVIEHLGRCTRAWRVGVCRVAFGLSSSLCSTICSTTVSIMFHNVSRLLVKVLLNCFTECFTLKIIKQLLLRMY